MQNQRNYSKDKDSLENLNIGERYSTTGESEFSRESTVPLDENEVLSERHYSLGDDHMRTRSWSRRTVDEQGRTFAGLGPKGYQRSDERVLEEVSLALYRCSEVDATDIEVNVRDGQVHLKGSVWSREEKLTAEEAIENIYGVRDVVNTLRVKELSAPKRDRGGLIQNTTGLN